MVRHSFQLAESFGDIESTKEMTHTLYLKDANWLDIGVFVLSIGALGWVVFTLLTNRKLVKGKDFGHNQVSSTEQTLASDSPVSSLYS